MEPSSVPVGKDIKSPFLHGVSQARLSIVECPKGMVPILRNSRRDQIEPHIMEQVINMNGQQEVSCLLLFVTMI